MKTVKMTRAQLQTAIAEKRGWTKFCFGLEGEQCGHKPAPDDFYLYPLPDYLGSMDAAIVLLRELPNYQLTFWRVTWSITRTPRHVLLDSYKEAEAIACAWWQFTSGEIVELCE